MAKCKAAGCQVTSPSKMRSNGYCEKHQKSSPTKSSLTAEDENVLLKERVATLEAENVITKHALKSALSAIDNIHKHLNLNTASINSANYERDALNQYGRRESGRALDIPEEPIEYDGDGKIVDNEDCAQLIVDIGKVLELPIVKEDIQRAHRVGPKRKPHWDPQKKVLITPKPRPVIVKFKDYGKRMSFIKKKKSLRENAEKKGVDKLKNAFIVEDLTPLRSKLLWYAKNHCNGKFKNCHTKNGRILAQTSGSDKWISLSTPDEFHAHGIDIDLDLINANLRCAKILKDMEFPILSELL